MKQRIKKTIKKTYCKTWTIMDFFQYKIYEIDACGQKWLQADPVTPGTGCRSAKDEKVLKSILEKDCIKTVFFKQKLR